MKAPKEIAPLLAFALRLPPELEDYLTKEAGAHFHSLNSEILTRLQESVEREKKKDPAWRFQETKSGLGLSPPKSPTIITIRD